jgi:hypothetical protein
MLSHFERASQDVAYEQLARKEAKRFLTQLQPCCHVINSAGDISRFVCEKQRNHPSSAGKESYAITLIDRGAVINRLPASISEE